MVDRDPAESIFAQVLERPPLEWQAALEQCCSLHPSLAPRLREMFRALERAGLTKPAPFPERLGDFRLIECLGTGGMGAVFRAEQRSLRRSVAIKVMRPEGRFFPEHLERFRREVDALSRLQHPGIVKVFEGGEHAGVPYCVMELVDGCTLADALQRLEGRAVEELAGVDLARAVGAEERLFPQSWVMTCFGLIERIAEALQHAHEHGVVHRDVKPSNIMLGRQGQVLLIDFGLARVAGHDGVTSTGAQLGSLPYLAPEIVAGSSKVADELCDIYGLGATLYQTLALSPPFAAGDEASLGARILRGDPPPLRAANRSLSRDAESVCMQALEAQRGRRYASAAAMAADLRRFREGVFVHARPPRALAKLRRLAHRHPWPTALIAAFGTTAALGLLTLSYRARLDESASRLQIASLEKRVHDLWNLGAKYIRGNTIADHVQWAAEYAAMFAELGLPLATEAEQQQLIARWRSLSEQHDPAARLLLKGLYDFEVRLSRAGCHLAWAQHAGAPFELPRSWDQKKKDDALRAAGDLLAKRPELVMLWPGVQSLVERLEADPDMRKVQAAWITWKLRGDTSALAELASQPGIKGKVACWLGDACIEALGAEAAVPVLERAVEFANDDFQAHFLLARCHRWLASQHNSLEHLEAAIRHYDVATALDPASPWAWTNLGEALIGLGELNPGDYSAQEKAALQRASADRMQRAMSAYRKAIALNEHSVAALHDLANCLDTRDPERRELLERALRIAPNDMYVLRSAAQLAQENGDWDLRLDYERRALAASPDDLESLCDCSAALFEAARTKLPRGQQVTKAPSECTLLREAIGNLRHATAIDATEAYPLELLFTCRAQLGEDDAALQNLEKALELRRARLADPRPLDRRTCLSCLRGVLEVLTALEPAVGASSREKWKALHDQVRAVHEAYESR